MATVEIKIYSLEQVAPVIGRTYDHLRQVMKRIKRGELASYEGYRFAQVAGTWIAWRESETYAVTVIT